MIGDRILWLGERASRIDQKSDRPVRVVRVVANRIDQNLETKFLMFNL